MPEVMTKLYIHIPAISNSQYSKDIDMKRKCASTLQLELPWDLVKWSYQLFKQLINGITDGSFK